MSTRLQATRIVTADDAAERFLGDPGQWLPQDAVVHGPSTWRLPVGPGRVRRQVALRLGQPWAVDAGCFRTVRWEAAELPATTVPTEAAFPVFVGEIGLRQTGGDVELVLEGRYEPPGGVVGRALDRVALHHVADLTARHLLDEIASRFERHHLTR